MKKQSNDPENIRFDNSLTGNKSTNNNSRINKKNNPTDNNSTENDLIANSITNSKSAINNSIVNNSTQNTLVEDKLVLDSKKTDKTNQEKNKSLPSKPISIAHKKYLLNVKLDKIKVISLQIAVLLGFFGLWEALTVFGVFDSFITSSPTRILKMFIVLLSQDIFMHVGITLLECILSFVISTLAGCIIAVLLWWSQTARRVSEPFIVVINSLPKIALGPIIIVWMGVGIKAIVIMGILICIVVTIISTLNGFLACDQGKILLLQSMGASKLQIFFKLVFPNSIPNLLAVLKINVGLAWVGTIMGEYLVSGAGLGYLIIYGGQVFKLDLVMTATLILCVLAALMYLTVALIEKAVNKHRV